MKTKIEYASRRCAHSITGISDRKFKVLSSVHNTSDIEVEKVSVEDSLNNSGHGSDRIEKALGIVPVDPIEDIESTVDSKCEQIVSSNGFCGACGLEHEKLRHNSNSLKVDTEGPQNFHDTEFVINENSQKCTRNKKEHDTETVGGTFVGGTKLH